MAAYPSYGGAERVEEAVECKGWKLEHEGKGSEKGVLLQLRGHRQDDREEVDPAHHLHGAHLVHREQLVLISVVEGVERQIT